jgi:hypothetical protein
MSGWKRNQMEQAISATLGQGLTPSPSLQTKLKRLLDTDRELERKFRPKGARAANFAFYSSAPPGRGAEVLFSEYEVFALLMALNLMEHGSTQARAVSIIKRARPRLEPKHAAILKWNPADLFDEKKIRDAAREGSLAVSSTRPVFLAIASPKPSAVEQSAEPEVAVLEANQLMAFSRKRARYLLSLVELTKTAHVLHHALENTTASKRGRGSA